MIHNIINRHDLIAAWRLVSSKGLPRLLRRMGMRESDVVASRWTSSSNPPTNWYDLPAVQRRWNTLISGDPMMAHYEYIAKKYLKPLSPLTGLSLGCGTGEREFCWSEQCQFRQLRAIDISRDRIDAAKSEAQRRGFSHLAFEVADVQAIALPESHYDVVFGEHSLHHFKQLAHLFASISRTLKPNGYFVVNEYVGPSRFQWTDRQLEAINGALELLPHQYRKRWSDGSVKRKVWRPSLLHMWWTDPSEAAESGAIRDELHKRFEVIEIREYGGGILHMLLAGIAMNFQSEDEETIHLTRLLFEIEDTLMKRGDIESDFMLAVARRRDS